MQKDTISMGALRDEEFEPLCALAESIWRINYRDMISPEQIAYMLEQRYRPGLLRQLQARGDRFVAARAGDELVGFAHAYLTEATQCKLDKLYVSTELQRHGIGGQLVSAVVNYARQHGCEQLVLRVNKRNFAALAAYRKYGFTLASAMIEDIGNGYVMDDYVLAKPL